MPPDKLSIGPAEELTERSDADVREDDRGHHRDQSCAGHAGAQDRRSLFAAAMDEATIEARGIAPLQPHLDAHPRREDAR
jgi:predicted metalloendopeptidase